MIADYINLLPLVGYPCALMLVFVVLAKISMPYSKRILKWLNNFSRKKIFVRGLAVSLIVIYSVVLMAPHFVGSSVHVKDVLIPLVAGILIGLVCAGIIVAVLRYSYDYIVDNDNEK